MNDFVASTGAVWSDKVKIPFCQIYFLAKHAEGEGEEEGYGHLVCLIFLFLDSDC